MDVNQKRNQHDTYVVPAGACDCHIHVFGNPTIYPMEAQRAYTPRPADLDAYGVIQKALGFQRFVLVQPSVYGADNSCMIDALKVAGESARGIAVVDAQTSDEVLDDMHKAGVRGVRLNVATGGKADYAQFAERLRATANRIRRLGWHIQLFVDLATIDAVSDVIAGLSQPVVIDHMGLATAREGVNQPGFSVLTRLLRGGNTWVKLSAPYRISDRSPDFPDVRAIVEALIEANQNRLLWGSDWPHTPKHSGINTGKPIDLPYQDIDSGYQLRMLLRWIGDNKAIQRVLVDNPGSLYGFSAKT